MNDWAWFLLGITGGVAAVFGGMYAAYRIWIWRGRV